MALDPRMILDIVRFSEEKCAFDSLPPEVVYLSKEVIVNAAAVGLAGAAQVEGQMVTGFAQEMGGNGRCTIIGKGLRSSPVYATLVNGMMIQLLDFDDEIIATGTRAASAILPVVMALGEMEGIPGREVLSAFALGCEVTSKLKRIAQAQGSACESSASMGAAAAAARLLKLDPEKFSHALGLAAGDSSAEGAVSMAGRGQAFRQGRAAMAGLTAAMLAGRGLRAAATHANADPWPAGLPGKRDPMTLSDLGTSLGNPFDILDPGVALRLYPCASQAHTAIDAALQLIQQYRVSPDEMISVRVAVTPSAMSALPYPTPSDGWEARHCLSFIVACALTYGQPLIDNFADSAVGDSRVRGLMDRITLEATESPIGNLLFPASIEIELGDGRRLQHRTEFARGHPELPLSPEELDAKFLYCSRYILPPDHIDESITRLRDLENLENTTGIFSVLGG